MLSYWAPRRTHFLTFTLVTTIFRHTSAAVAQPSGNLIQRPTQQGTSDSSAAAVNSTSLVGDPRGEDPWVPLITCYPPSILPEHPLPDPRSCAEAIQHIPDEDKPLRSFSDPNRSLQLPHRFSSSDGKCVVSVGEGSGKVNVVITGKRLRSLATAILYKCIFLQKEDGDVFIEGRYHDFMINFAAYNPSGIKCVDRSPEPAPSGCEGALEMMRSDWSPVRYTDGHGEQLKPWDVELPETFLGPQLGAKSTCMILLDLTGEELYTPARIWQAAVAINAVCARRGQMGLILGLGLLFSLSFSVRSLLIDVRYRRS